MGEANVVVNLVGALKRTIGDYIRAGRAIAPEQENRELRVLGGKVMVVGVFNTVVSYCAFFNPPPAIPNYMHLIPFVIQCFTFFAGIILMATGWFLVVSENPRQHGRLVKIILFVAFIASALTMGVLLEISDPDQNTPRWFQNKYQ